MRDFHPELRLGIDPKRIAIGGASAGGGLAAPLALVAHDRGEVRPAFQLLVYPMLDDRTATRTDLEKKNVRVWSPTSNHSAWTASLGHPPGLATTNPYAAAARRDDLRGLPPAWIGVGTLDLFHDEDVTYAKRLEATACFEPLSVVLERWRRDRVRRMRAPLLLTLFAITAIAKSLEGVPSTGAVVADFAPKGWVVESSLAGELDGDPVPDVVVVLIQEGEGDRSRALLWLRGAAKGFTLVDSNVGLVACFSCLGMKGGDAKPELEIVKKVLVVTQWGGSRESYGATHRFRVQKGVVRLIGVDHSDINTLTGAGSTTSENLLTGVTVFEKTPAVDDNDKSTNAKPTKKTTKKKVGPLPEFNEVKEYGGY